MRTHLVRAVKEGQQAPLLDDAQQRLPLRSAGVHPGGIVGAGLQQHDGAAVGGEAGGGGRGGGGQRSKGGRGGGDGKERGPCNYAAASLAHRGNAPRREAACSTVGAASGGKVLLLRWKASTEGHKGRCRRTPSPLRHGAQLGAVLFKVQVTGHGVVVVVRPHGVPHLPHARTGGPGDRGTGGPGDRGAGGPGGRGTGGPGDRGTGGLGGRGTGGPGDRGTGGPGDRGTGGPGDREPHARTTRGGGGSGKSRREPP